MKVAAKPVFSSVRMSQHEANPLDAPAADKTNLVAASLKP